MANPEQWLTAPAAATTRQLAAPPAAALLPSGPHGADLLAKFFRALGDPTRLRLLDFLRQDEHTVTECVEHVGLSQGRVSSHLACLADCGYVRARRQGRNTLYRMADPRVAELVLLASALAADNAAALTTCRRIEATSGQ